VPANVRMSLIRSRADWATATIASAAPIVSKACERRQALHSKGG
jgi:hypothetical protein